MDKDRTDFADLWKMLPNSQKVKYQVGFDCTGKTGEVLLLDEADVWFFGDPK